MGVIVAARPVCRGTFADPANRGGDPAAGGEFTTERRTKMAKSNTEWRYHYAEADDAAGIDFEKYGRNGFELCGLVSHAGKLVAVFKRSPTAKDGAARATRKAKRAAGATGDQRGTRGR
jgi:hypothetical protein